jgi:excisionase family DNA binding protein
MRDVNDGLERAGGQIGASAGQPYDEHRGKRLLDLGQAARYLGTTERHIRRLWQERRIAAVKIGRRVRFDQQDLDAFVEANRQRALR